MNFEMLLQEMVDKEGSDMFITAGVPPSIKRHGRLMNIAEHPLTADKTKEIVFGIMNKKQTIIFTETKECNFALQVPKVGRFRVNAFYQKGQCGAVLRHIESDIPTFKELKLPLRLQDYVKQKKGLVLLVGGTGAGKSSTLASMIQYRNMHLSGHIVTVEDPIEYLFQHENSIVTQREVGVDTESFEVALKNTLRQAPDVIMIGEIRNQETMSYAINFAETGHLCLATLHANNANQALDRIINFFPIEAHKQLLSDLALNLKAVVAQQLVPTLKGKKRRPVLEILVNTPAVAEAIRKGAVEQLKTYMDKGSEYGMQTFDQALFRLYQRGKISSETALQYAESENEVRLKIKLDDESNPKPKSSLEPPQAPTIDTKPNTLGTQSPKPQSSSTPPSPKPPVSTGGLTLKDDDD